MLELVRLSNFDRLLNIHQSVKLEQVANLNLELLKVQLKQNHHLNILNNQIAESNYLNRQLLQNQIAELKRAEEQKFYKSLVFNCFELIEKLGSINDSVTRTYFVTTFNDKILANLGKSKEVLEEIADKIEVKKYLELFLKVVDKNNSADYQNSILLQLNGLIDDFKKKEVEYTLELNSFKKKYNSVVIPSEGFWGFGKKARGNAMTERITLENEYKILLERTQFVLNRHDLFKLLDEVKDLFPEFNKWTNEIAALESVFKSKFEVPVTPKIDDIFNKDELFEAAVKMGINAMVVSSIMRKFDIGYKRASKIQNQLRGAGYLK